MTEPSGVGDRRVAAAPAESEEAADGARTRWPEPSGETIAAAAAVLLPYVLAVGALGVLSAPDATQLEHADPFLRSIGGAAVVAPAGVLVIGVWLGGARPSGQALHRALRWGMLGAAVAVAVAVSLRLGFGPTLPGFIPPEESAKPGLTQGLAAGVGEELLFRLVVLPGLYFGLRRRMGRAAAAGLAAVLTGLAFALAHELPPLGGSFEARFLATRILFPGVVMSLAFLVLPPAFIVAAHATAHLAIPALFA